MRVVFTFSFVFFFLASSAQEATAFKVVDTTSSESFTSPAFCTPGILNKSRSRGIDIAYNFLTGGMMRPEQGQFHERPGQLQSLESIIVKVKAPVILKPGLKILVGFNYQPETYTFATIPQAGISSLAAPHYSDVFRDINTRFLKHTSLNLYALKPLNEHHYFGLRFRYASNGDYTGIMSFRDRYAAYQASIAYGIKKHEDLEYGFALAFSKNFRRTLVLPAFIYNRNFNDKWGLETVFPAYVNGRYNIDRKSILLFGYEFNSQAYSINVGNRRSATESVYHLRHSEFLFGASLERRIVPWVWMNIKAGYQVNLSTNFDAQIPGAPSYQFQPANAPYLRMGVFVSPPDRMLRR